MQATQEKLIHRNKKKRAPIEEESNQRRSAYAQNDNAGDNFERGAQLEDEEKFETSYVERRGHDSYGSTRKDQELEYFVVEAIKELAVVEANTTEQELDAELKAKVDAVTTMADAYGFTDFSNLNSRGLVERERQEVEDDDAEDFEVERKRSEGSGQEEAEKRVNLRAVSNSVDERESLPLSGLGTILYETSNAVSVSECRKSCREESSCDSILLILNSGLCILHKDV